MEGIVEHSALIDHLEVIWLAPAAAARRRLILFLPPFSGSKETVKPYLRALAEQGFLALSFDPWQHGSRGSESREAISKRVFGNFRRYMWPILGQTTLDSLKVVDWAVENLNVETRVTMTGLSMGGDVSVAAASMDQRVSQVIAVVATPDWTRPGMHDLFRPEMLVDQGKADIYAEFFYRNLDPLSNVERYTTTGEIKFICGSDDTHVPATGALNFKRALTEKFGDAAGARISVHLIAGMKHLDVKDQSRWWPAFVGALGF